MAIDTANKRASCINVAFPLSRVLPLPDAVMAPADRYHLAFLYRGLAADVGIVAPRIIDLRAMANHAIDLEADLQSDPSQSWPTGLVLPSTRGG